MLTRERNFKALVGFSILTLEITAWLKDVAVNKFARRATDAGNKNLLILLHSTGVWKCEEAMKKSIKIDK